MSDVPRAKAIIEQVLKTDLSVFARNSLMTARALLDREQPEFKAPPTIRALTEDEKREARRLRDEGWAINAIARRLHTNIGRVSEAINDKDV